MPVQTSHVRQRIGQLKNDLTRLFEDDTKRGTLQLVLNRLDKTAGEIETEEQKIKDNPHLTPQGRQAQLRDLSTKKGKELQQFLSDELTKATDSHRTLSDLLFTNEGRRQLDIAYNRESAPIEEDRTLRYLREQEIRMGWRDKPQAERDREYIRALHAGDHETARALSNAPGGPLVTADTKRRVDTAYAEQRFPAAYENFSQVSVLREQLQGLSDLSGRWLDGLGTQA